MRAIVRAIHSSIFRHIQGHTCILRHIQELLRNIEPYNIQTYPNLSNPCIYSRAIFRTLPYLEPEATSKACQICRMIRHNESPDIVRTVYSYIFKDI